MFFLVTFRVIGMHTEEYFICGFQVGVIMLSMQGRGNIPDVIALVGIRWKGYFLTGQVQVAQPHRGGEYIHLTPGIVDIVFTVDIITHRFQQVGQGRAISRPAPMPDMQRSGRIGRDIFNLDPLVGTDI